MLTHPGVVTYEQGTTGHYIGWTVNDSSTGAFPTYEVKDASNVTVANGTWASGSNITYNIDGLTKGTYNYTLVVYDNLGYSASDTCTVIVTRALPQLTSPVDISYEVNSTGHTLAWTVTDSTTSSTWYNLTCNGTFVQYGTWMSGGNISRNVDGLSTGTYIYTLLVNDGLGDIASDNVIVTVNGTINQNPTVTHPADINYTQGTTGHAIIWTLTDADVSSPSYTITCNYTVVSSGTWVSGTPVSMAVDGLAQGLYFWVINATDGFGGSMQDEVFITVVAPTQFFQAWNRTWGGTNIEEGSGIAVDGSGNAYVAGYTNSFGSGGYDALLVKYATDGTQIWNRTLGGGSDDVWYSVTVDSSGNIYLAGYTSSFGAGSLDVFYAKYAPDGTCIWNRTWGWQGSDYMSQIAIDPTSGNLYFAGTTYSYGAGNADAFFLKCSPDGTLLWNRTWGGTAVDEGIDVAVDSSGNIYFAGRTDNFGVSGQGTFLSKYSSNGTRLWNRTWDGPGFEIGYGVAVSGNGYVYLSGTTNSFGAGTYDAFLAQFTSEGTQLWNRTWGGIASDEGYKVVVDSDMNALISGYTYSYGAGSADAFAAKFSSDGSQLWNLTWGGTNDEQGYDIAVNGNESIYLVGYTTSYGVGGYDAFIVKLVQANQNLVLNSPADISYAQGATGNLISWIATDDTVNSPTYLIFRNGTIIQNGTWTSSVPISFNADGLVANTYVFTIIVWDGLGLNASDMVIVQVFTGNGTTGTLPVVVYDTGFNVLYGASLTLNWTITDAYPLYNGQGNYILKRGSGTYATSIQNGTWVSGDTIHYTPATNSCGYFIYELTVDDGYGNQTIVVTQFQVLGTFQVYAPASFSVVFGEPISLSWTLTNLAPGHKYFWAYSIPSASFSKSSSFIADNYTRVISFNYDYTTPGNNTNIYVTVQELGANGASTGNYANNYTLVTITIPSAIPGISPKTDYVDYVGNDINVSWTVYDGDVNASLTSYTLYVNGTVMKSGAWESGDLLWYDLGLAPAGTYTCQLYVFDGNYNFANATYTITVVTPVGCNAVQFVLPPSNRLVYRITQQMGTSGSQGYYAFNFTGIKIMDGASLSNTIFPLIPNQVKVVMGYISYWNAGTNSWTCWYSSPAPLVGANDTMTVYFLNFPILFPEGTTMQQLNLTFYNYIRMNLLPQSCDIFGIPFTDNCGLEVTTTADTITFVNATLDFNVSLTVNSNQIAQIVHVHCYTYSGQTPVLMTQDTVLVSEGPEISIEHPADVQYEVGTSGHTISWTVTGDNGTFYTIARDGIIVQNGSWTSGESITTSVDGLSIGTHSFNLTAWNTYGYQSSDLVTVTVIEQSSLQLSSPPDLLIEAGTTGNSITWIVTDTNASVPTYEITQDGVLIQEGTWVSGGQITTSVDGLGEGIYSFTLTVWDGDGNSATDSVFVTVNTLPQLTSPSDISYEIGTNGNNVTWIVTDSVILNATYVITCDSSVIQTGMWINDFAITANADGLSAGTYSFILDVYDGYGDSASDEVLVIVNSAPQLSSPVDIAIEVDSIGNTISWTVTDGVVLDPTYAITQDGWVIQEGTWTDGSLIAINVDGFGEGSYVFTLTVWDGYGDSDSDSVIVIVNAMPLISSPSDLTCEIGTTGNNLSWTIIDPIILNGTYEITRDAIVIQTGTWSNGYTVATSADGLGEGVYIFALIAWDGYGDSSTDIVVVTINAPPIATGPSDMLYEIGSTGHVLYWTIVDGTVSTSWYTITWNGTVMQSGSWSSGQIIEINVDGHEEGQWTYMMTIGDGNGDVVTDEVLITVNAPPELTHPSDLLIEIGTTGNVISWNVIDETTNSTFYIIIRNGIVQNGTWSNGQTITGNVDGLGEGYYDFILIVWDGYGDSVNDTVVVTVNAPPELTHPSDLLYEIGTTGHVISWNVTDATIDDTFYIITQNGLVVENGTWISGQMIVKNVDGLAEGYYEFILTVEDGNGDVVDDTIMVTVNAPPQLTQPADILIEVNTTGHAISWNVLDATTGSATYIISRNGNEVQNGTWTTGQTISVNVDGLGEGYYAFTLSVWDGYGDFVNDTAIVTVNAPPQLTSPANVLYELGTTGHSIQWNVIDATTTSTFYTITRNGIVVQNGTWTTGQTITLNVDGLGEGYYTFVLTVQDGNGDSASDSVIVTVNAPPQLTQPADILFEVNTTGHVISWNVVDATTNNATYVITQNGIPVGNGTWSTGQTIPTNVDSLGEGYYSITLTVSDGYGDSTSDTVLVTVNAPPQLTHPANVQYEIDTTGHVVNWTVTDATIFNGSYVITRNGTVVQVGTWENNDLIEVNVDGLAPGWWRFRLSVNDGFGDATSDAVMVRVNAPPQLTSPADIVYENNTTGNFISWTVTDTTTGSTTYIVRRNGVLVENGTWVSGDTITINVDGLNPGTWSYTLTVRDGFGDVVSDVVIVTVNIPPRLTHPSNIAYEIGETGNSISWNVTDATTAETYYIISCNGTTLENGTWITKQTITFNVDGLSEGYYAFTLTVSDGYGDSTSDTVIVRVNAPPLLTSPADIVYESGTTGHTISWNVTDATTGTATYVIRRNGTRVKNGTWVSGDTITINVDGLAPGTWSYTLTVRDGFGDVVSDVVLVTVNAPPQLTHPANVTFNRGTTGNFINWSVTDDTTGSTTYTITQDGVVVQSGTWVSGDEISVNLDGLAKGIYAYVITVTDGLGDSTSDTVSVRVK